MPSVDYTRADDGTAVLRMQRPPANATNLAFITELTAAVQVVAADPPGALMFTGLPGFFCAGADLKDPPLGPAAQAAVSALCHELYRLPCPVIGAVTGHAIGLGLLLVMCCDARIGSGAGRYGVNEVALGFPYPEVALHVMASECSPDAARVLGLGSELHDGDTLLRLGLFDELAPADDVEPRAIAETRRRAEFDPGVYAATKRALRADGLAAIARTLAAAP